MSLALLMDEHVKTAVTRGLRQRDVDVITAQEDGGDGLPDEELLDRATALGRLLVTHDEDFLVEASKRRARGQYSAGIIFGRQEEVSIGKMISDLELIAYCHEPLDVANQVIFIPLR
jgi:predicted nuclease of predicted toxin-antitoxin system